MEALVCLDVQVRPGSVWMADDMDTGWKAFMRAETEDGKVIAAMTTNRALENTWTMSRPNRYVRLAGTWVSSVVVDKSESRPGRGTYEYTVLKVMSIQILA